MRPSPSALLGGRALTAGVSTWTRIADDTLPPRIKALPNYANSRLASLEAERHGYDAALMLNRRGTVAESTASCVFIVRDGVLATPPLTASILESITRDSLLMLCRETLGLRVEEREIDRTELYTADEAFLCGTQMEVMPLASIDGFPLVSAAPHSLSGRIGRLYHDVVRGLDDRYAHWLTPVEP
jgi:branched-chain amino acid aminotransferase